jgi:ADP-ribose pyrophosphatase YjhB (NUDIX family)
MATRDDPDTPVGAGIVGRLHTAVGRFAISARARFRAPISLGVRLLALNVAGEVLLVRHSYLPGLALPGGGVEPGETAREAAMREAVEETGLEFAAPPVLFHLYLNRKLENRDHVALFVAKGRPPAAPAGTGGRDPVDRVPCARRPAPRRDPGHAAAHRRGSAGRDAVRRVVSVTPRTSRPMS